MSENKFRHANARWIVPENPNTEQAAMCVQMDIRDTLMDITRLLRCQRIPKALDAIISMGVDVRRKRRAKRTQHAKRKQRK